MRLQLALDRLSKARCIRLAEDTKQDVDIIEIGTGVIKEYGMSIIREMRELFPDKTILADMKTCDAAKHEVKQALEAGADITTVMGFSADASIKDALQEAEKLGGQIMIDLLEIQSKQRVEELASLGVKLVSLHVGKDQQSKGSFHKDLFKLTEGTNLTVAVAGGINAESLPSIVEKDPDIIIVGSTITGQENPQKMAGKLKSYLKK
ncbi:3-hexulose-6-phosphate synthase [Oceanobacillus jeddahense]|uniref:3-hexulose-6-phosphate synthase n=1 Tax=Oceanobacillus jeddahense TaxID=1462527 RepID=A0ABY5JT85_9BACI|nr:3-hexulose-6-phosphate synthase [Oceanobacillus jeddahense]UUI02276.1 orotidine 5'-phosphate decarboxylase [Oceanobacillus jeddahense]